MAMLLRVSLATLILLLFVFCLKLSASFENKAVARRRHIGYDYSCGRINSFGSKIYHVVSSRSSIGSTKGSFETPIKSDNGFTVSNVSIFDLLDMVRLAGEEFFPGCQTPEAKLDLVIEILRLFLPKLLLKREYMGHTVLGLRSPEKRLIGFVDLSLQPSNGTLDALKPLSLRKRKRMYGEKNLQPYLCNLLVTKDYRKRGLGKVLVNACVEVAKQWGHGTINLHVETNGIAALSLYLKTNFLPVESFRSNEGVMFMRKKFPLLP